MQLQTTKRRSSFNKVELLPHAIQQVTIGQPSMLRLHGRSTVRERRLKVQVVMALDSHRDGLWW